MKKFKFNKISIIVVAVLFMFGALGVVMAFPPTPLTVALGTSDNFAVLAGAAVTDTAPSVVVGDVGLSPTTGAALGIPAGEVTGIRYDVDGAGLATTNDPALLATAKSDLSVAFNNAKGRTGAVAVTASTTDSFAGIGTGTGGYTLAPGVYNSGSTMGISAASPLVLDGGGNPEAVFIFQAGTTLTTETNSVVSLINGAQACNVFWQVGTSATFGTTSTFTGTVMAAVSITDAGGAIISGRLLADADNTDADNTGAVTLNNTRITVPTCAPATVTLHVVKVVVNDSDTGTKIITDFPLFVNGSPVVSGAANTFSPGTFTVTETTDANYTQTFSSSCPDGVISLASGEDKTCTITNDDIARVRHTSGGSYISRIPPIIDVVKVPSPLALPAGPGDVTYTYTLRNIGTVPVYDVKMVDDFCSPMKYISGDVNASLKLEIDEVWTYQCTSKLLETTKNTVVATGWANGISATDIAYATVVVGKSVTPPLIHVTKVPSPLALLAGPGSVIYTEKVTNPGVVALSNIKLSDDKCSPMKFISGDMNNDSKLDTNETWTYICQSNLTQTTTNTASVEGEANGIIAKDFAIATVVVSIPGLPKTGFPSQEKNISWYFASFAGIVALVSASLIVLKKSKA